MRLSDITAGVRAVATAHCCNRATMHRPAKCRYRPCDQQMGKQRESKQDEKREEKYRDRGRGIQERNKSVAGHVSGETYRKKAMAIRGKQRL